MATTIGIKDIWCCWFRWPPRRTVWKHSRMFLLSSSSHTLPCPNSFFVQCVCIYSSDDIYAFSTFRKVFVDFWFQKIHCDDGVIRTLKLSLRTQILCTTEDSEFITDHQLLTVVN